MVTIDTVHQNRDEENNNMGLGTIDSKTLRNRNRAAYI